MGQEEALLLAATTVAFSWEQEQGVLKPVSAPAVGAPDMPESPKMAAATVFFPWEHEPGMPKTKPYSTPAPVVKPRGAPEFPRKAQPPTRRLSVPPPPGRPPPGRPPSRGFSCAVRPEDDPFLAAYLACTKSTGGGRGGDGGKNRTRGAREPRGQGRIRRWAEIGLSCKRGDGAVVQSMVRLAKLPELDPRDD